MAANEGGLYQALLNRQEGESQAAAATPEVQDPAALIPQEDIGGDGLNLYKSLHDQQVTSLKDAVRRQTEDYLKNDLGLSDQERLGAYEFAARHKVSPDFVARNFRSLDLVDQVQKRNPEGYVDLFPETAKYAAEHDNAPVVDDLHNLGTLEWIFKGGASYAFERGIAMTRRGILLNKLAHGGLTTAEQAELDAATEILSRRAGDDTGLQGFLADNIEVGGQFIDLGLQTIPEVAKNVGAAGVAALAVGGTISVLQPELAPAVATFTGQFLGATAGASGAVEFFRKSYQMESGYAYEEYVNAGVEPDLARKVSDGVGVINAVWETLEVAGIAKAARLTPVGKVLRQQTFANAVLDYMKAGGLAWINNVTQETLQEITTIAGFQLAAEFSQNDVKQYTAEEIQQRVIDTIEQAGKSMLLASFVPGLPRLAGDIRRANRAAVNEQVLRAIGDITEKSTTAREMPTKMRDFVERMTKDGKIKEVYVDANEFRQYFQEQGIDPEAVAAEVPSLQQQLADTQEIGGDLVIPMADWIRFARTEHYGGLSDLARFNPDEMSPKEARQFLKSGVVQDLKATIAEAERKQAEIMASNKEADVIYQNVRQQLIDAGQPVSVADQQAALYRAFFKTLVEGRANRSALKVFEKLGLRVLTEDQIDALAEGLKGADVGNIVDARLLDQVREYAKQRGMDTAAVSNMSDDDLRQLVQGALRLSGAVGQMLDQTAYHGSPYEFDRFSLDAVGSGEGFQAFGWGLYFADKKSVAEHYKNMAREFLISPDGEAFNTGTEGGFDDAANAMERYAEEKGLRPEQELLDKGVNFIGRFDMSDAMEYWLDNFDDISTLKELAQKISGLNADDVSSLISTLEEKRAAEKNIENTARAIYALAEHGWKIQRGQLYKVDLKPNEDEYLLWDEPVRYQTDKVKKALIEAAKIYLNNAGITEKDIKVAMSSYPGITKEEMILEYLDSAVRNGLIESWSGYSNPDSVSEVYWYLSKALGSTKAASEFLLKAGIRGIKYLDGSSRSKGDGSYNYVIFDDSDVEILSFDQKVQQEKDRLSALHNLSAENLKFADELGGIAVPSIAVVRSDMGVEGFGEITLIGTSELADPAKVDVFDSDAYTTRFPKPEYRKPKVKDADALINDFRPYADKYDGGSSPTLVSQIWHFIYDSDKPNPKEAIRYLEDSNGAKAWFLKELTGRDTRPVMRDAKPAYEFLDNAIMRDFIKSYGIDVNFQVGDDYHRALSDAVSDSIESLSLGDGKLRESFRESLFDDAGLLRYAEADKIARSLRNIGKREVDVAATRERLDKKLKGKEANFHEWASRKVLDIMGEPYLMIGRKKAPYTLENIVEFMQRERGKAKEDSVTFSAGKARAATATKFESIDWMRNAARDAIKRKDEIEQAREEAEKKLSDFREAVVPYYTGRDWKGNIDTWSALDDAMRAIAKWGETRLKYGNESALRKALSSVGFKGVPKSVIEQGVEAGEAMLEAPVPYFEAKPDRAVKLDEFAGAVVPDDADKETLQILKKHGLEIRKYPHGDQVAREAAVVSLREKLARKGVDVLFQKKGQNERRGGIQLPARLGDANVLITLSQKADLSTFLHESAHLFLEIFRDLATDPNATEELKQDWEKIKAFLGIESDADVITSEQHEMWAESFEKYLFDGKAPSAELEGIFATFRSWLIEVYRGIKARIGITGVEPSDEIRGVFDRMLASDDQIKAMRQQVELTPMFKDAQSAGMTEEQFARYQKALEIALRDAETELIRKALANEKRARREAWAAAEAELRPEIEKRLQADPVYQATRLMTGDEVPEGAERIQLDREAVKRLLEGEDDAKQVMDGLMRHGVARRSILGKQSVDPDAAALMFGFESGLEMLRAIAAKPSYKKALKAQLETAVRKDLGDILAEGKMEEAALDAVHGDPSGRFIAMELKVLAKRAGTEGTPANVARQIAREIIRDMKVGDIAASLNRYLKTELKAANAAVKAAAAQDWEAAARHKRTQLINHYLYTEARKANEQAAKIQRYLAKFDRPGVRKNLDRDYLDRIDAALEAWDLRKSVSKKEIERRKSLAQWVDEQLAQGNEVAIDPDVLENARRKHYKDATFGELMALSDSIHNIEHLARLKHKLVAAKEKREFDEVVETLVDDARRFNDWRDDDVDFRSGKWETLKDWNGRIVAEHLKPEMLFRQLDGDRLGAWWHAFFAPIAEAEDLEQQMMEEAVTQVQRLFDAYSRKERSGWYTKKIRIDEIDASLTKEQIISVALNWGNEGNRKQIMEGFGWNEAQVKAVLSHLDEKDWDFVQGAWDLIDSFWPQIAALEKELTGVVPPKVKASEFFTPDGRRMRGGYYPLVFDPRYNQRIKEKREAEQDLFSQENNWLRAATRHGHTKMRVDHKGYPVELSLGVFTRHITNVIHDLAFRKPIMQAEKLRNDARIREAIIATAGRHAYDQIRPWLQAIANDQRQLDTGIEQVIGYLRKGTTIANMGLKVSTAMMQPLGFTQSIDLLGEKWAALGLAKFYANPARGWRFVTDRSVIMRSRMRTLDRDVRDAIKRMTTDSLKARVEATYFQLIGVGDMAVSLPTWMGAYEKAIAEGKPEAEAISEADSAVRLSQGAGGAKDLAAIQRGGELKRMLTMFYSYFSTLFNLLYRLGKRTKSPKDIPRAVLSYFYLVAFPAVMSEILMGRGPEDDEDRWKWAIKTMGVYPAMSIVGLRDVVNAISTPFDYQITPIASMINTLAKGGKAYAEGNFSEYATKNLIIGSGAILHLPTRQAYITLDHLFDVAEGRKDLNMYELLVRKER